MTKPLNTFEKQVLQIASLGVLQIVTGRSMKKRLEQVIDPRWESRQGLFVTIKKDGVVRGSMGLFESSTSLPETLFNAAQNAATHDKRFQPVEEKEISNLQIEVVLLSQGKKILAPSEIIIGSTGLIVTRGENQAVLLPQVATEQNWSAEQFLEACCEKAQLSHKAWKDPNTLVETFHCQLIEGGSLLDTIKDYI